jgi:hypothetical protein
MWIGALNAKRLNGQRGLWGRVYMIMRKNLLFKRML